MRFYNVSVVVERRFWPALTARCFFGTCAMSLSFYAMQQMVLADASVLLATSPVTTFFLGAVLLGEHIDPISLCFALLSFVGVTCVSRPTWLFGAHAEDAATKAGSLVGALCCLLSATSVSFVYVSMRRLQQLHFLAVIHYFSLTATTASLVPLLWQGVRTHLSTLSLTPPSLIH
jgi:drug/metabolite transporter (DMT)-like permease